MDEIKWEVGQAAFVKNGFGQLSKHIIAKVFKNYVELDNGDKYDFSGRRRGDRYAARLRQITPELIEGHRRQNLVNLIARTDLISLTTDTLIKIRALIKAETEGGAECIKKSTDLL